MFRLMNWLLGQQIIERRLAEIRLENEDWRTDGALLVLVHKQSNKLPRMWGQ